MRVCLAASEVRELVKRTLQDFGVQENDLSDLAESVLVDDGKYIARAYQAAQYLVMWLLDAGQLQFFDGEGRMLRTANLFAGLEPDRLAA